MCIFQSDEEEEFLVLPEQNLDDLELMKERRDRLQRGEPVRAQLDRQPQAYRPSPNAQHFELPPEFYNLTAEELKKEQQQKYDQPKLFYVPDYVNITFESKIFKSFPLNKYIE